MNYPEAKIRALLDRRGVDYRSTVRVVEVGSTAHGMSTSSTDDDFDATVIRVESFEELVIGSPNRQSMMIRTQPEGVRSRMGDIDLNVYTLRKFAALASGGNPSILGAIFSEKVHRSTLDLEPLARMVASKRAGSAFLGYMRQQLERWQGVRGQKNVNRPELVDAYGFDTKYAAHVIRLGVQGVEYMETGRYSMPLDPEVAGQLIVLREGGIPEADALAWAEAVEQDLLQAVASSPLPAGPNTAGVNAWLTAEYAERAARVKGTEE